LALPFAGRPAVPLRDIIGYRWEVVMADMLIRDVPDDVVAVLEARARRLGLSLSEYVRRRLAQDAAAADSPVSAADLVRFAESFSDWQTLT
jgi:plasmid stability protein